MTRIRSLSAMISLSSAETRRIAQPRSRSARSWPWMNSIAADIDAARRLLRNQDRRSVGQLARHHDLLQVSSGQRADRQAARCRSGCRTSAIRSRARSRHRGTVEQPVPRQRRVALESDCEIFRRRRRQTPCRPRHDPPGCRRAPPRGAHRRRAAVTSTPCIQHRAAVRRSRADQRFDQFRLPVAGHAGDANDLAGAHV